ncbi:MAG: hypothetical protein ACLFQP_11910, partial [Halothece sp.]
LDYRDQQTKFESYRSKTGKTAAFLITDNRVKLQRWLVKRLACTIRGFHQATRISIRAYEIRPNFQNFLDDIAKQLNLSENTQITEDNVIKQICLLCKTKLVILAVYEINILNTSQSQDTLNRLLSFWKKLVEEADSQKWHRRSRLILFLTEHSACEYPFEVKNDFDPNHTDIPVRLGKSAQINRQEVKIWLDSDPIFEPLCQIIGENQADSFLEIVESLPSSETEIDMDFICQNCGLEEGVAQIEHYWELTA